MYQNEFSGLPRGPSAVKWSADGKIALMLEGSACILDPSGNAHRDTTAGLAPAAAVSVLSRPPCHISFTAGYRADVDEDDEDGAGESGGGGSEGSGPVQRVVEALDTETRHRALPAGHSQSDGFLSGALVAKARAPGASALHASSLQCMEWAPLAVVAGEILSPSFDCASRCVLATLSLGGSIAIHASPTDASLYTWRCFDLGLSELFAEAAVAAVAHSKVTGTSKKGNMQRDQRSAEAAVPSLQDMYGGSLYNDTDDDGFAAKRLRITKDNKRKNKRNGDNEKTADNVDDGSVGNDGDVGLLKWVADVETTTATSIAFAPIAVKLPACGGTSTSSLSPSCSSPCVLLSVGGRRAIVVIALPTNHGYGSFSSSTSTLGSSSTPGQEVPFVAAAVSVDGGGVAAMVWAKKSSSPLPSPSSSSLQTTAHSSHQLLVCGFMDGSVRVYAFSPSFLSSVPPLTLLCVLRRPSSLSSAPLPSCAAQCVACQEEDVDDSDVDDGDHALENNRGGDPATNKENLTQVYSVTAALGSDLLRWRVVTTGKKSGGSGDSGGNSSSSSSNSPTKNNNHDGSIDSGGGAAAAAGGNADTKEGGVTVAVVKVECVAVIDSGHGHNVSQIDTITASTVSDAAASAGSAVISSGQDGYIYEWSFPRLPPSPHLPPSSPHGSDRCGGVSRRLIHASACGQPLSSSAYAVMPCKEQILGASMSPSGAFLATVCVAGPLPDINTNKSQTSPLLRSTHTKLEVRSVRPSPVSSPPSAVSSSSPAAAAAAPSPTSSVRSLLHDEWLWWAAVHQANVAQNRTTRPSLLTKQQSAPPMAWFPAPMPTPPSTLTAMASSSSSSLPVVDGKAWQREHLFLHQALSDNSDWALRRIFVDATKLTSSSFPSSPPSPPASLLPLSHSDVSKLVGWSIGIRWAAAAATAFLATVTARGEDSSALGKRMGKAEGDMKRGVQLSRQERLSLSLIVRCLATPPPSLLAPALIPPLSSPPLFLESSGSSSAPSSPSSTSLPLRLSCALSSVEVAFHVELSRKLRSCLEKHEQQHDNGNFLPNGGDEDVETCPLCDALVPWKQTFQRQIPEPEQQQQHNAAMTSLPSLGCEAWGKARCDRGHVLMRCTRRLILLSQTDTHATIDSESNQEEEPSNQETIHDEEWCCDVCRMGCIVSTGGVGTIEGGGGGAVAHTSFQPFSWIGQASYAFLVSSASLSSPSSSFAAAERTCVLCAVQLSKVP